MSDNEKPGAGRIEAALVGALRRLLSPVIRTLLRYGVSYKAFSEVAKRVYVDVARSDFTVPGRKMSASRISLVTGLTRRDVAHLLDSDGPSDLENRAAHNRIRRLTAGWANDERFRDKRGRPASLALEDEPNSFAELARLYGNDVPSRALLDELLRLGTVDRTKSGRIRLVAPAYVPAHDELAKIEMLGSDVADLAATIDHNIADDGSRPMYQRKVAYDDLPEESIDALRAEANSEAQRVLEKLDRKLRRHSGTGTGSERRLVLGVYVREEDPDSEGGDR